MSGSVRRTSDAHSRLAWGMCASVRFAFALAAANSPVDAQSNLGQLSEIRGSRNKSECKVTGTDIPSGPVRVNSGGDWRPLNPVFPREQLRANDRISVRREVDARLTIDEPSGMGADISLAPKLVCSFVGIDAVGGVPADSGAYALARSGDTVVFTVNRGAAYIQWTDPAKRCLLRVVAQLVQPIVARVCGTQLVVSVDATGNNGYLFVRDGVVLITSGAIALQAAQGQLVRLGGQARVARLDDNIARRIDLKEVQYHSTDVWNPDIPPPSRSIWRRPWTYIGLAAVGGVVWVATEMNKDEPVKKTVIVRIPL